MKLADAKERAVDTALRAYRAQRSRSLMPAAVATLLCGLLFLFTLPDPGDWAKGDIFKPGHALHDLLGYDGLVLAVRGGFALLTLLALVWLVRVLRDLSSGLPAKRAEIAAAMRTFDPPDRP